MLLRIVACEGERLLLSCELRPDSRDKLLKSLSGELDRELCCERSRRFRTGMRDTESRRMDKSEGVSRCAASYAEPCKGLCGVSLLGVPMIGDKVLGLAILARLLGC